MEERVMDQRESCLRATRREFLGAAAGAAVVGTVGWPLLTACTRASGGASGVAASAILPTYVPFKGPRPELAPTDAGVQPGYLAYPRQLVRSVTQRPGRGGDITALTIIYMPPPPPVEQNAAWQEVNRQLGANLKMVIAARSDIQSKLATVVAGGDLPDTLIIPGTPITPPHLLEFLKARCEDLTPHLAGDAVKAYPNLANIPTASWQNAVVGGSLYGVAIPRPVLDYNLFVQQNVLDASGVPHPKNADDFLRLMKELTRPQSNRWGLTAPQFGLRFFAQLFRVPNRWRLDAGDKLVRDLETDEHRAMVAYVRQLQDAGVFYPGSAAIGTTAAKTQFNNGTVVAVADGFAGYVDYWNALAQTKPEVRVRTLTPFGHDGGRATYYLGTGTFAYTVLKKASADRVKEILRVLDFLAAPFGSEEYQLLNFGVKDVDYTVDSRGNPGANARGTAELYAPWKYITAAPPVLYDAYPWGAAYVRAAHADEQAQVPLGVKDPTLGLYSTTDADKRAVLDQAVSDRMNDIITGRLPMSAYDQVVGEWRSGGGEQIRKEFQQALEQSKG
jgi:putative aldouronate transport system substrate-binding protein